MFCYRNRNVSVRYWPQSSWGCVVCARRGWDLVCLGLLVDGSEWASMEGRQGTRSEAGGIVWVKRAVERQWMAGEELWRPAHPRPLRPCGSQA